MSNFHLDATVSDRLRDYLAFMYGTGQGVATWAKLRERLLRFAAEHPALRGERPMRAEGLRARDAMLITYGDQVHEAGRAPLATLDAWLAGHLGDDISSVHLLPFYPYTSDDGFSIVDYSVVDPALGDWDDIGRLAKSYRLMFDAVINHVSAHSAWFEAFLAGDERYANWFITVDQPADLSTVTRPRTHPLLTTFETARGPRPVWTTFSTDQIDLNFGNPEVLLAIVDVLLLYAAHGAGYIRLDAIGYMWKEIGTSCIHLPEVHTAVKLFRSVYDAIAPEILLITETNVPHRDNISYFGNGDDEAQLVYQFPLAPLVLNAFQTGSTRHLSGWAAGLETPSEHVTFFNFLASHDGIGVMPASGILSREEIDALVARTLQHGGRVGYKTNSDGSQSAYELNITLMDALSDPRTTPADEAIERFMTAQAIMLALRGLPGIYVHSLVGSHNDLAGMARTGHNRTINRRKWERGEIDARLADPASHESRVLARYRRLLRARASSPAFDVAAGQRILEAGDGLFALERSAPDGERVVCLHNVSGAPQSFTVGQAASLTDLITDDQYDASGPLHVAPYASLWLRAE
jgi:glucosylglycerate phosphorylase